MPIFGRNPEANTRPFKHTESKNQEPYAKFPFKIKLNYFRSLTHNTL